MADIEVERRHRLGAAEARAAVERVAEQLRRDLGVDYHWERDALHFSRKGARGRIDVDDAVVRVAIDLGRMLRPAKGKIRAEVEQVLAQRLG